MYSNSIFKKQYQLFISDKMRELLSLVVVFNIILISKCQVNLFFH